MSERQRLQDERDQFFTLSRDLLCIVDFDGCLKALNPDWERTLGFTRDELTAEPAVSFAHPEDRESAIRKCQSLLQGGETVAYQIRTRTKSGSYRWLLWNAIGFPERKRIYAAARDITELKQAERSLHERTEQFRRLFEGAPIGMSIFGPDRRFSRVNSALAEMLGYNDQELLGRSFPDFTHPLDLEAEQPLAEQLSGGRISSYNIEKRCLKKNREALWTHVTTTAIQGAQGNPLYLAMVENIQDRKRREEEIRKLNQALEDRVSELSAPFHKYANV
jgi:PAS domain S-box-containing protein